MKINNTEFVNPLEDILSELRSQLALNSIELLERQPRESGNNIQIQCIYHGNGKERKPSAGIRKTDGLFHCFACGETHDFPEFVSNCFGRNDKGAFGWEWLRKNFLVIEEENRDVKLNITRNNTGVSRESDRRGERRTETDFVSEEELEKYRYIHPYLKERGIVDDSVIELFDLGFDAKTNCITFPVRDITGRCLFVARRNVKTKFFNYPDGVQKPLYGLYELHNVIQDRERLLKPEYVNPNEIFVCESMIDCILLWQARYYAVAMNGLGNKLCFQQLNELPCRTLVLATDNDKAGYEARERIRKQVKHKIFKEVIFPKNRKDVGECTEEELKNLKVVFV